MNSCARRGLRLLLSLIFAVAEPVGAAEAPSSASPVDVVTLPEAIAAALVNNPELAVQASQQRIAGTRIVQAGLIPNPELQTEVENFGGGGDRLAFEETETTISLAQAIELGGKRSKRKRLAETGQELTNWDYEVARLDVLTAVAKAFIATLAAQQRAQLFADLSALAHLSVDTVDEQIRAGATSSTELLRAQADLGRTEAERRQADQELAQARVRLAAKWGNPRPTFRVVAGDLSHVETPPPLATLLPRVADAPDVARWTAELENRRAAVELERAEAIPNLTLSLGGRHFSDNGDNALVGGFSIPLPVFNRNQGDILAAEEGVSKATAERTRATVAAEEALAAAYEDLRSNAAQVVLLRDDVLPKSEAAFRGTRDAYERGLLRFLDVLDSQRTWFEVRDQLVQTLAAYHSAAAEVERWTGLPLSAAAGREEGGR